MTFKRLIFTFTACFFLFSSNFVHAEKGLLGNVIDGAAQEVGKRLMGGFLDSLSQPNSAPTSNTWRPGSYHPRYPHVIASDTPNNWMPESGYVWADGNDRNDWTVIPNTANRSSYFIGNASKNYEVVYGGRDGVNLRSSPGGKDIISTAYKQRLVSIKGLSEEPYYLKGIPWVKVKLIGWMVKSSKSHTYVTPVTSDFAYISWNGDGNPTDNFMALRAGASTKATRIAKVYTYTSVKVIESKSDSNFEWIKAEIVGWMAVKGSSKGNQFLVEISE